MFDQLNTQVVEATEADLLSAFDEPADDKGKKTQIKDKKIESDKTKKEEKKKTSTSKEKPVLGTTKDTITEFSEDDDSVFDSKDDEDESIDDDEEDTESTTDKDKKKDKEVESDNEDSDEDSTDDDEEEKDKDESSEDDNIKDFLKARANLLIKKGEWADFEGSDEHEWDEDSFAEMEVQQRAYQKQQMREDLLESFGPYGKEIADYAAKGGDPDKLIDIFKEQQRVESLNITTEDEQRAVVMKYETEFLNKKPERVKKYIDSLIADKELENEAKEAKASMEESLNQQTQELQAEQEEKVQSKERKQKENIQKFQSDVSSIVSKMEDITSDERKQLLTVLTKFDKKLKNGMPVNDFYFKFDQFRKDLPNYIKLVRFVLNPDKFIKSIENNGKSIATEKAFKLARSASKNNKVKAAAHIESDGKAVKTKFKLF